MSDKRSAPRRPAALRLEDLSSRERQIMDVVCRKGRTTVADLQAELRDAPSPSAVRPMLSRLEEKGLLRHEQEGPRNVYESTLPRNRLRDSAVDRLMKTFFDNSPVRTTAAILDRSASRLAAEDLDELARLIEEARKRGS